MRDRESSLITRATSSGTLSTSKISTEALQSPSSPTQMTPPLIATLRPPQLMNWSPTWWRKPTTSTMRSLRLSSRRISRSWPSRSWTNSRRVVSTNSWSCSMEPWTTFHRPRVLWLQLPRSLLSAMRTRTHRCTLVSQTSRRLSQMMIWLVSAKAPVSSSLRSSSTRPQEPSLMSSPLLLEHSLRSCVIVKSSLQTQLILSVI